MPKRINLEDLFWLMVSEVTVHVSLVLLLYGLGGKAAPHDRECTAEQIAHPL